jgi:hypothetical protein
VCIVTVTVDSAVTVEVMLFVEVHVLSADPDKLIPIEFASESPETADTSETVLLPNPVIVGIADSPGPTDDS